MIISHSKKFVFVHIQKNAGTSITKYLAKYQTYQDIVLGCTHFGNEVMPLYHKKFNLHKHSQAKNIRNIMGDETWSKYFSFSFVRNPYDRMVSLYNWCRKGKFDFPICKEAINAKDFSQFIRGECFQSLPQQLEYLSNNKGDIIVDFVGKQENIQADFDRVCKKLQIPNINMSKFKHNVRVRSHDNYQDYYTSKEDIEIVKNKFASDIKFFEYKF